jgi:hypothetical protein
VYQRAARDGVVFQYLSCCAVQVKSRRKTSHHLLAATTTSSSTTTLHLPSQSPSSQDTNQHNNDVQARPSRSTQPIPSRPVPLAARSSNDRLANPSAHNLPYCPHHEPSPHHTSVYINPFSSSSQPSRSSHPPTPLAASRLVSRPSSTALPCIFTRD